MGEGILGHVLPVGSSSKERVAANVALELRPKRQVHPLLVLVKCRHGAELLEAYLALEGPLAHVVLVLAEGALGGEHLVFALAARPKTRERRFELVGVRVRANDLVIFRQAFVPGILREHQHGGSIRMNFIS